MKNFDKIKKQVILLFTAVEGKDVNESDAIEKINCKKQQEVDEFTEIWELVKS